MAVCFVLTASFGHAQTLPSETDGNPNEVLVFEQMRVPRWLTETVVRAAQVTGVDPAYLMALADKESSLLPDNKARTSSAEGLFSVHREHLAGGAAALRPQARLCGRSRGYPGCPGTACGVGRQRARAALALAA